MVHSQILGKTWLVHKTTEKTIRNLYSPRFPAGDAEHPLTPPPLFLFCVHLSPLSWPESNLVHSASWMWTPLSKPRPDSIDGLGAITQARLPPAVYPPQCRGTKFVIVPNTTKNKRCSSNSPMSMTRCSALWHLWTNEDSQWMNSPLTCREQLSSGRRGRSSSDSSCST